MIAGSIIFILHAMPRRRDLSEQDPQLTRKRTADMLRRLRQLTKDVRMLRACAAPQTRTIAHAGAVAIESVTERYDSGGLERNGLHAP